MSRGVQPRFEGGFQIALWEVSERGETLGAIYYCGRHYKIDSEKDPDAPSDTYRVVLDGHVVATASIRNRSVLDAHRGVWDSMTIRRLHAVVEETA